MALQFVNNRVVGGRSAKFAAPRSVGRNIVVSVSAFVDGDAPKTAKTSKAAKNDGHIKRAPSAYNLYFKSALPGLKADAPPGTKATALTGKISELWKNLSMEDKQPFVAEAEILKTEVAAKRDVAKAEAKKNRRPLTPYTTYVAAHFTTFKQQNPDLAVPAVMNKVAESWKALPEADKAVLKEEYQGKLAAWKVQHSQA